MGSYYSTSTIDENNTVVKIVSHSYPIIKYERTTTFINDNIISNEENIPKLIETKIEHDDELVKIIKNMSFDSNRIMILKDYLKYNKIDKKYINDIVNCLSFDSNKLEAYRIMIQNLK